MKICCTQKKAIIKSVVMHVIERDCKNNEIEDTEREERTIEYD
jgi:hypothetical protein